MKTKGIVMRTSTKLTVIFTEKGDFLEIPTPKEQPKIGQTIEVIIKPYRLPSFHNSWLKYSSAAAVLLLVLSISAFYLLFIPNMAVASVALDINKGIELLVNNQGKVIKVRDVNGGSSILEGVSIKGLDVYQTVNLIIENAHKKGELDETQNLILANVVPVNRWGRQLIDTEILRNTIRDEMIRGNLSGSVVVGQTTQKIQQEAQQQGMTVNSYLIYDRCEEKGIAVQAGALRNNVQKALLDAKVNVSSLFPAESLEVRAQKLNDNPANSLADTQQESNVPKGSEHNQPSKVKSEITENHNNTDHPKNQSQSSASSPSTNGSISNDSSHTPVSQPPQETSLDSSEPSSGQMPPDHITTENITPQEPISSSHNGETDENQMPSTEKNDESKTHIQSDTPQSSGEHTDGDRRD